MSSASLPGRNRRRLRLSPRSWSPKESHSLPAPVRHRGLISLVNTTDGCNSTAQGIGKAIALRLAEDGFDIAVNDIPQNSENLDKVVEEIKAKGRSSSAHLADVSVEEQVKEMVAEVVRVYDGLDVVRQVFEKYASDN